MATVIALAATVTLLAAGAVLAYPFEMDTVVSLSGGRLVATHYGLYNTVCGIGITLGNLIVGALWHWSGSRGLEPLTWLALAAIGAASAAAVRSLARSGRLVPAATAEVDLFR